MHRVVVTGLGCVTPIGPSAVVSFQNLLSGLNGIRNILSLPEWSHLHQQLKPIPSHLAAPVLDFPPDNSTSSLSERTKFPRSFLFAEMAAKEALKDSNLESTENVGVFFGCGMPGVNEIYENSLLISENDSKRPKISPYFIPAILGNSPAGHISRTFGLKGPMSSPSLACATGAYAIGEAFRYLRDPNEFGCDCDAILAGATETPLTPPAFAGFSRLRALSTSNSTCSSRPFDTERNGFVLGEGAGCLLLERLEAAQKRNANIYAEIIGFGSSSDAFHPTAPDPSNSGAIKAIKSALNTPCKHDLIAVNAHATSTPLGDEIELAALEKTIPSASINVISNKGAIGHLLGASGAVESIFTVLSLHQNILPANQNLKSKIKTKFNLPTCNITLPKESENSSILKTSFGFGGANVALLFKKFTKD